MSSCRLMFPGVVWCSQNLDLSLLFLVFSLIFTVASRLLLLYSTIDKKSRLKMKSFSTVGDTQRGSELHGEEKREEEVRDYLNKMRWTQKRRE